MLELSARKENGTERAQSEKLALTLVCGISILNITTYNWVLLYPFSLLKDFIIFRFTPKFEVFLRESVQLKAEH